MTSDNQDFRALEAKLRAREARIRQLEKKYARTKLYLTIAAAPYALLLSPILLPAWAIHYGLRKRRSQPRLKKLGAVAGTLGSVAAPARDPATERAIDAREDSFALCRIIGNDLTPRHRKGQSHDNVRFILENEPPLDGCRKLWLVNRIADPEEEARILALLEAHGQDYERIPFDGAAFLRIGYDFSSFEDPGLFFDGRLEDMPEASRERALLQTYRLKNNYVMNNNGARNRALDLGLRHAKWALPWDGNCFVTATAWDEIRAGVIAARDRRYILVPMARTPDNALLTEPGYRPDAVEEPQLIFRCDATARFDERHPYGRRPKVELFVHLGIPGPWQDWAIEPWDLPPRPVSAEGHRVGRAGWVARLDSGQADLEQKDKTSFLDRGLVREVAIKTTIDMLDRQAIRPVLEAGAPVFYRRDRLTALAREGGPLAEALGQAAEAACSRGPYSVTDKTTTAPSGDPHDYWHPAPYWWPNPKRPDGLPYIRRDGERVPGTELYSEESDKYDRTRLQRLFDDTTVLALAATILGETRHADRARTLIRHWFVEAATLMTPHLSYAQVRMGHNGNRGAAQGLIETKDFYFLLDAVRLLDDAALNVELRPWCRAFYDWLLTSDQGRKECSGPNNHGTCYDLQIAAFAAWLGDEETLLTTYHRSQARLFQQIDETGWQAHEMERSLTQHYCAFNLQSWCNLFQLYAGIGLRPWQSPAAERLRGGLDWFLGQDHANWPHAQIAPFDRNRLHPLRLARRIAEEDAGAAGPEANDAPPLLDPHDGIAPFWQLAF